MSTGGIINFFFVYFVYNIEYMCSQGHWKCLNGLQCISEKRLCDGYIDCKDKSDESIQVCKGKVQYIYSNKGNKFGGLESKHVGFKMQTWLVMYKLCWR